MVHVKRSGLLRFFPRRAGLAAALWIASAVSPVAAQPCPGDCSSDGSVTIDELITCVNVALGTLPLAQCPQCNTGSDADVDIDDLVAAVNSSLNDCPAGTATPIPTATGPTATPSVTATVTPTRVLPDLEFSGLTVVPPTPTGGCTSEEPPTLQLRACATNIGNAPSAPFDISVNGTTMRVDMNLAPTGEACLLFEFSSGDVSIQIDSGMVIEELDESNNTGSSSVPAVTPLPTCAATATITPTPMPPVIGLHECAVGGPSQIDIKGALPLPPLPASGVIEIDCGSVAPNGKAPCSCEVQAPGFPGLDIAGLFFACVKPAIAGVCPTGEIDCDGGNVLGLAITGTRNIGACTSQADCLTACATQCGGTDNIFDSGCEGFCTDGANSACTTDAGCGTLTEGSCDGPDGAGLGNICDCTCLNSAVGGASVAGTLQCQLAFNLTVEPNPGNGMVCDGADVSINVGDTCAPLSTQSAMSVINNGNNGGTQFPPGGANLVGAPADCTTLAAGNTSAITLQGAAIFYASTIGDLNSLLTVDCQ